METAEAVPLLEFSSVTAYRGDKKILSDISFCIRTGEPYAIMGESGSGKTTLLLCATGLLQPKSGKVSIVGAPLNALAPQQRASRVGLVFQDYQLFPHLSVQGNIELAPRLTGSKTFGSMTRDLLEALRIQDLADRRPHQLSGGQKQRVAIARSLILEPVILFLDEPSAALDEKATLELAEILRKLNHRVQIIVVSHDRYFVEACCKRGVIMKNGKIGSELSSEKLVKKE
jgi:ABC-type sulfate/molybdate transport systems ATPase subunit